MKSERLLKQPSGYVAAAWLALALFDATQTIVTMKAMDMHHAWVTLFFVTAFSWAVWALATPVVVALLWRFRLPAKDLRPWAVHGLACMVIGALWATWAALLEYASNPFAYAHPASYAIIWQEKFLGNLVGDVLIYGAVLALNIALDTQMRLAQQQSASAKLSELLAQAQLSALRVQIEPHFIFNALNAVTGLIREQRHDDAITVIANLGDLLRRVTDRSDRQFVGLDEEIDFLRKYLDIQQTRFAERLRYQIDIPAELMKAQVPEFILQPLVENAIKHGIAKRAKGGALKVVAARAGTNLTLSVYNDGPLLPAHIQDGVGLSNIRQRLNALYGSDHTLSLQSIAETGVQAELSFPYREG